MNKWRRWEKWCRWGVPVLVLFVAFMVRVFRLGANPPSLYVDEAALAYDAYSLLHTGKDIYGQPWYSAAFESFGDFKPPGYVYAVVIAMKVFGAHDWVVRLPSMIAGVLSVWLIGRIAARLFPQGEKDDIKLSWIAMLVAAFCPALMQTARVGFESNLATAFFLAGICLLLSPLPRHDNREQQQWMIDWAALGAQMCLLMAFWTYHTYRFAAPVFGLVLICWRYWPLWRAQKTKTLRTQIILMLVLAVMACAPMFWGNNNSNVTKRLAIVGVLGDEGPRIQSDYCYLLVANSHWWKNFYCHPLFYYSRDVINNYFAHFSPFYLFLHGDANTRHSIQVFGVFYPVEMILTLVALIWLVRNYSRQRTAVSFLTFWWLVGLIPASLAQGAPHLLRSLVIVPAGVIVIAWGWWLLGRQLTKKWWRCGIVSILATVWLISVLMWQLDYYGYYRRADARDWYDGLASGLALLQEWQQKYPDLPVYISHKYAPAAYYYFWYRHSDPLMVQDEVKRWNYHGGKIWSYSPEKIDFGLHELTGEHLFMLIPEEYEVYQATVEADVARDHAGNAVFWVGRFPPLESSHE